MRIWRRYEGLMSRQGRSTDWGFPRWRGYGSTREAEPVRLCDRHGCNEPGKCPAPKAPNSPERWMFCEAHAAEYNKSWDYFAGLSKEEAAKREHDERRDASGYKESAHYGWAGSGDGSRTRDEMRALEIFGLDPDSTFDDAKKAWRAYAKECHPDVKPGDADAAKRFAEGQAAYDVLRVSEELRQWKPSTSD